MMDSDLKKRAVTEEQIYALLEFMKEHPVLAQGLNRGKRGKFTTVKLWNTCAKKLNNIGNGAAKDGKGWSRYWCDWKYRVRRHALELRAAQGTNKPPEGITPLSQIEETIMSIIGESSIEGFVIKSDPLLDQDSNEEANGNDISNNEPYEAIPNRKSRVKRRRQPSVEDAPNHEDSDNDDDRTSPPLRRPKIEFEDTSAYEEDYSAKFLRLEEKRLETTRGIQQSLNQMSAQMCKLVEILGEIRDAAVKKFNNIT